MVKEGSRVEILRIFLTDRLCKKKLVIKIIREKYIRLRCADDTHAYSLDV